jgi:mannose-6-phosphate isomerase-like protein (cupin superfamily)
MRRLIRAGICLMCVSVASSTAGAQAQATTPGPAPAPGSPATFKSAADLAAVLQKATANAAGMLSSPVTANTDYRVSLIQRAKPAGALAHPGNTELLYITEGAGTMITGGTLVPAAAGKPASIVNGVSQHFTKGDVIIVPVGSPHWFATIDSPVTYLEVRWVAPK